MVKLRKNMTSKFPDTCDTIQNIYPNSETNSLKNPILISLVESMQDSMPSFPPKNREKKICQRSCHCFVCVQSRRRLATHYLSRKSTFADQIVEFVCLC